MTVKEAIKEIIKLRGLLIFNDYNKFIALLLDLGNSNQKELNIFKSAVNEKILKLCIDDSIENSQKITKIKIRLEDNGFSENTINFVIDSLVFALGWNYMKNQDVLNQTGWTCSCGTLNTGNFCSNCGSAKPQPKESKDWTCSCGTVNAGNFCSNCGKAKPVTNESKDWTCSCGTVNTGNFCSNCGKKKGEQKVQVQKQENPFENAKVGDYIKFGSYPTTGSGEIQPIEWQVLSIENNKMFVVSRYGLEARRFDSSSNNWAISEIRKWLNGDFYNKAFNEKEKKYIKSSNLLDVGTTDNVFLLSGDFYSNGEANEYFANSAEQRRCKATDYAVKNGAYVDYDSYNSDAHGYSHWWLRSSYPGMTDRVFCVAAFGYVGNCEVDDNRNCLVRPALWINI